MNRIKKSTCACIICAYVAMHTIAIHNNVQAYKLCGKYVQVLYEPLISIVHTALPAAVHFPTLPQPNFPVPRFCQKTSLFLLLSCTCSGLVDILIHELLHIDVLGLTVICSCFKTYNMQLTHKYQSLEAFTYAIWYTKFQCRFSLE